MMIVLSLVIYQEQKKVLLKLKLTYKFWDEADRYVFFSKLNITHCMLAKCIQLICDINWCGFYVFGLNCICSIFNINHFYGKNINSSLTNDDYK